MQTDPDKGYRLSGSLEVSGVLFNHKPIPCLPHRRPVKPIANGMADDFVKYPRSMRANTPEELARLRRRTAEGGWLLTPSEIWWRDHQSFLNSHGYLLRPRFRPDWIPSWTGTNIIPNYCEDSIEHLVSVKVQRCQRVVDTTFVQPG